jgi:hypothetical protein
MKEIYVQLAYYLGFSTNNKKKHGKTHAILGILQKNKQYTIRNPSTSFVGHFPLKKGRAAKLEDLRVGRNGID